MFIFYILFTFIFSKLILFSHFFSLFISSFLYHMAEFIYLNYPQQVQVYNLIKYNTSLHGGLSQ
jgi:hypothetical protein